MKKIVFSVLAAGVIIVAAAINLRLNTQNSELSDIFASNWEALAGESTFPPTLNKCSTNEISNIALIGNTMYKFVSYSCDYITKNNTICKNGIDEYKLLSGQWLLTNIGSTLVSCLL
jgi:hypothetical protein